jgi:hypothetical protein
MARYLQVSDEIASDIAAEPLISALREPGVQSAIGALGGYDLSRSGSVEMLT